LGLKKWDLFLNLGRVYLEQGDLAASTGAFKTAVSLGADHAEAHFNLGLAYERRGMIASAEQQILVAVRLDPGQPDARNMLGLVYTEEGDFVRARKIWTDLARTDVDFEPARRNLAVLDSIDHPGAKAQSRDTVNFRTASSGVQDFCRRRRATGAKVIPMICSSPRVFKATYHDLP
jgi:Flp pilus assembly protein TadD